MSFQFNDFVAAIKSGKSLDSADVLHLRQWLWSDGVGSRDEVDHLFALNSEIAAPTLDWTDFFVETVSGYVVNGREPRGYVSDEDAGWLISKVVADGQIDSMSELALIVRVLERATNAPDRLKNVVIEQIERTVLTGKGPTRSGGSISPGQIDHAEVDILRRLIFAPASNGPACVSALEAEMLFRLKDATLGSANAAGWQKLFVQGVGNFLMAHSDHSPFSRDEAAKYEALMNDTTVNISGFLARMSKAFDSRGAWEALKEGDNAKASAAHDVAVAREAEIVPNEQIWLNARIDADGVKDELEAALVEFLAAD